ncbi:hypothetical protein HYPSUDRAFT_47589 [Hypholoma sublateritium FD-334 SS-4]|uniref:Uncharacterized protein n=1 Tax=Hypholoma sublateritium (strain FD-334 SS-4) TaxID=945553 RepID=A0A0D2NHR7_HYPSF|nr:hypothetical protein HYPSUDRAFT_47589 [Hypholoma sublateritium FD-334 SS-4]
MDKNATWKFAHRDEVDSTADSSKYAERGRSRDRKAVAGSGLVDKLFAMGLGRANSATNSVPSSRQQKEVIIESHGGPHGGERRAGPASEFLREQDAAAPVLLQYDTRLKDAMFEDIEKQAKELFPDTQYVAPRAKVASRKPEDRSLEAWRTVLRPSADNLVNSALMPPTTLAKTKAKGPHYRKPVPRISVSPTRPLHVAKAKPGARNASPHHPSRVATTARAMDLAARRTYRKPPNYAAFDAALAEGLTLSEFDMAAGGITIADIDDCNEDDVSMRNHRTEEDGPDIMDPFMYEEFRSLLETHRLKKELNKYHAVSVPSRLNPIRGHTDVAAWIEEQDRVGHNYKSPISVVQNKHYLSLLGFKPLNTKHVKHYH